MRCAVYHPDGICPDVRDCEACKEDMTPEEQILETLLSGKNPLDENPELFTDVDPHHLI